MGKITSAHAYANNEEAFIAWSTGAPIGTIFKGIVQAGLDVPVGTTDGNMTFAQMTQYAAFLPKQLFIPAAEWAMHGSDLKREPAVMAAQERLALAALTDFVSGPM